MRRSDPLVCPYRTETDCELAGALARRPAPTTDAACRVCSSLDDARTLNEVTASLALSACDPDSRRALLPFVRRYLRQAPPAPPPPCVHRADVLRHARCQTCGRELRRIPVYRCRLHGECVLTRTEAVEPLDPDGRTRRVIRTCRGCSDRKAEPEAPKPLTVSWTVTPAMEPSIENGERKGGEREP